MNLKSIVMVIRGLVSLRDSSGNIVDTVDDAGTRRLAVDVVQTAALHASTHEVGGNDLVSHDNLTDYVAAEHIDWTAASAGTIDPTNYADTDTKVAVEDEGTPLTTGATKINFAGAGVTVTEPLTDEMLVTIPGGSYTHPNHTGDVTSVGDGAQTIVNDAVTYAKMQNVSATDRILGRDTAGAGDIEEITPAALRTMINVEDGSTADQSDAEIKTAYENNANTNAFTDAQETKVNHLTVTQAVNLDTIESDTATNNAKVTNATHTGEVTGSGALTVDKTAISNQTSVAAAATDQILIGDASDTDNLKRVSAQSIADLGGGGSSITVEDEGTPLTTAVTKFNFAGAGVTVTEPVTDEMLVTIPAGGSGAIDDLSDATTDYVTEFTMVMGDGAGASLSTGAAKNLAIGQDALTTNSANDSNTAVGYKALEDATGNKNTAVGDGAAIQLTTGDWNTAIGHESMRGLNSFTSGNYNTCIGALAGWNLANVGGDIHSNTLLGARSGLTITNGSYNICIGEGAGDNLTNADKCIIIGTNSDAPSINVDNQMNIGNMIYGTDIDGTANTISTGKIGIGVKVPTAGSVFDVTGTGTANSSMVIPRDTTANEPTAVNGMVRYDTTTDKLRAVEAGSWVDVIGGGGGGETNTASNVGTAAGKPFKQKTGVDLEFKSFGVGSSKLSVSNGVSDVDYDVVEANLTHDNIGGTLGISKGGTGQTTQTAAFDALAPGTTKGDILVYDGTDHIPLAVGTNGQVLHADNTTASGLKWDTDDGGAGGGDPTSDIATATADTTTTSATYVAINSMTITPPSGNYLAFFSASGYGSASGQQMVYGIHVAGTLDADSERELDFNSGAQGNELHLTMHSQGKVTANGSQAIDVRWKTDSGTFTCKERSLILIKVS